MRREAADQSQAKGWLCGPWDSDLPVAVGYATQGIDEPHLHKRIHEIYLVASGSARLRVAGCTHDLRAGDVVILAPGEAHTFLDSSPDYLHFVVHAPGLAGAEARLEKVAVPRERLD